QYIPFGALPVASAPLIARHEIVNLPSASALALLRRESARRTRAPRLLAVLADPVLEPDDPRVTTDASRRTATESTNAGSDVLLRSARDSGVSRFDRLVFTRREAEAILALAGEEGRLSALDFDASRETAVRADLGQYRLVHFATHGLLNSRHPELSGLVLSLVDEHGRSQDGFLRAHDIYNLRLGADLVVLSACRTALGTEIRGEGLLGLVRGFMYAGAPRVVASLWDVRDDATAELMKRFYFKMIREGLSPATALRAAQVSMWKDDRWSAPYYWAGFVLQGEWR
ncbi:MAG: CHAT domain-containing protein, partial [Vicinamibacterales bacterium]